MSSNFRTPNVDFQALIQPLGWEWNVNHYICKAYSMHRPCWCSVFIEKRGFRHQYFYQSCSRELTFTPMNRAWGSWVLGEIRTQLWLGLSQVWTWKAEINQRCEAHNTCNRRHNKPAPPRDWNKRLSANCPRHKSHKSIICRIPLALLFTIFVGVSGRCVEIHQAHWVRLSGSAHVWPILIDVPRY